MFEFIYNFMEPRDLTFDDLYCFWWYIPVLFFVNDLGFFDAHHVETCFTIFLILCLTWDCLLLLFGHPSRLGKNYE